MVLLLLQRTKASTRDRRANDAVGAVVADNTMVMDVFAIIYCYRRSYYCCDFVCQERNGPEESGLHSCKSDEVVLGLAVVLNLPCDKALPERTLPLIEAATDYGCHPFQPLQPRLKLSCLGVCHAYGLPGSSQLLYAVRPITVLVDLETTICVG